MMFTRLRNKFLFLNMSITSLVIIVAFVIIYWIIYHHISSDIAEKLNEGAATEMTVYGDDLFNNGSKDTPYSLSQTLSTSGFSSFALIVDDQGEIVEIHSPVELSVEKYAKIAETVWKMKGEDRITLNGKQWQYEITPILVNVIQGNGEQFVITDHLYQMTFLDVTEANQTLRSLLITLLVVGLIMLVIIFFISMYFANSAVKPIAKAWENQKQFVADASHELKTPLSIIQANYDVLMDNRDETINNQLKWLGYMKMATDRMTKMITNLLELAQLDQPTTRLEVKEIHLSNMIEDMFFTMEAATKEKEIHITHSIEPEIMLNSNSDKIKQLVMILLDNAHKYTNEKGKIDITLEKDKKMIVFRVRNTGKGIAEEDLSKIFNRFYRGDRSRHLEKNSFGLGLSIAKSIANELGGKIHVSSEENNWTTFTVMFPRV
ncbi:MAG TPA: HAMP domain-containing sensor histidine kinase [Virgibacillus sp.]|nr:HAMP domain-containing sensor histidine kinase [Virgibacillus sp.]HLR67226.1 HAMP domain-containing sensor histidine kinase [Virgibacillus sp.]